MIVMMMEMMVLIRTVRMLHDEDGVMPNGGVMVMRLVIVNMNQLHFKEVQING